jgi:hypothetical protein
MIFEQLIQQMHGLSNLLSILNDQHYVRRIEYLGNASIGEHTRHIIEVLQCAVCGYPFGQLDYVNRIRDLNLQTDRLFAQSVIAQLKKEVKQPDKKLTLLVEEMENAIESTANTSYFREIVYNTEHAIHHLALIKVALIEMDLDVVDANFGIAYSTIEYRATLSAGN